ncbi:tyrosine-type recombinase/integrase [Occallatibacter riparius]|uniref:Site-specific integrase n=1 Tax=Occallatibacter riparius TaxID=1002689 RepID=A0A9J7BUJ2_9BACT|nr:site-specific integrase [Occallatibacter riparius]UWZ86249.1 site-specific integrase [Occallatibacter riparius]
MAEILSAAFLGEAQDRNTHNIAIAKALIAQAGALSPQKLSAAHVMEIDATFRGRPYSTSTRWHYATALRWMLRWLWEHHGAPKLDQTVRKWPRPRPRNVTVHDDERAAILRAAPDHLRLWVLLCSDLAIRSGTAINIGPPHYNGQRGTLSFTTKCDEHLTLPVTAAVQELIDQCDPNDPTSYVRQLWFAYNQRKGRRGPVLRLGNLNALRRQFSELCKSLGTRRVTLHDHRRTTAVAMLEHTRDVREVQALLGHKDLHSTFWYLDHALRPIHRETLEAIKRPFLVKKEHTA